MKTTASKLLLDSSAWLTYFLAGNADIRGLVEGEYTVVTSVISLFEIKRKLLKDRHAPNKIAEVLGFIKSRSLLLELSDETAEHAANLSLKHQLPAIDSLIYTSAQLNQAVLVTGDNDFRGLPGTEII